MARGHRIILLFLALTIISFNSITSHISPERRKTPASFSNSSSPVLIRLKGELIVPGVYAVPDGSTIASVLYGLPDQSDKGALDAPVLRTRLKGGDVLEIAGEGCAVGISRMKAGERMVLGIPLDPDRMDLEDWSAVPGIGPRTAQRIVEDRQAYGAFNSIEGVLRVPGIGSRKYSDIKKFF